MATNEKAIETLIEAVKWLYAFNIHGLATGVNDIIKTNKILADLDALSARDSSAGTAEIELCGKCHERPCGCAKEGGEHEWANSSYRGETFCINCSESWSESANCEPCKGKPAPAPSPAKCEHEAKHVVSGYVSQNDITCVICSRCSTVGKRFDGGTIEWWPSPTPTAPEDQVPPWEAMNKSLDEWMCDYCGTEATRGIDFLIAQRDALRSRQNEVAKEVLKELQGLVNANRYHAGWIDAKLASLGGA